MKILCVSDTVVQQMENAAHLRRRYSDIELLISCGDLPAYYLEYITSVLNIPLFFVRGNHDTGYAERPPGGEDLHQRIVTYHGLTFAGLEGSIKYNNSPIQYSDADMTMMVMKLAVPMRLRMLSQSHGVDILVAHSPAKGIHDREDKPHNGLNALNRFMDWYKPRYMIHGHVHTWDRRDETKTMYKSTTVMNINPVTLLEIEPLTKE